MRILAITNGAPIPVVWNEAFQNAIGEYGEFDLVDDGVNLSDEEVIASLRDVEVAVVGWDARPLPAALARDPGRLRYVCCYSGTIRSLVPLELIEAGILVSNWGDHPANGVAEGAMALLLAVMKEFPAAIRTAREDGWGLKTRTRSTLVDTAVGIYGCGVIARRFIELLRPFGARIHLYDPYVESLPGGCTRCGSLAELCDESEVLVIHAGLSDETQGSLRADHLARLPDGGIVINTARGGIVDQDALFAELVAGRLRAGLDVLEPDFLAAGHPVRSLENVLLSFHQAEQSTWPRRPGLSPMQQRCLENLARFAEGETPAWLFDADRYHRST
jgi:phosphoglycerate dehydrogenase-like enzyme